jgi:hypothetical protein
MRGNGLNRREVDVRERMVEIGIKVIVERRRSSVTGIRCITGRSCKFDRLRLNYVEVHHE